MLIGRNYRLTETEPIKSNDQYDLWDDRRLLKNLVPSMTRLRRRQATNGHRHEGKEEVYIFTSGQGAMIIEDKFISVEQGDIVAVPSGAFHRVVAVGSCDLEFIAIFEAYNRELPKPVDLSEAALG